MKCLSNSSTWNSILRTKKRKWRKIIFLLVGEWYSLISPSPPLLTLIKMKEERCGFKQTEYNIIHFFLLDGYYIYLETSGAIRTGSKAQLQSPNFNINRGQRKCLSLWYHMYGPNVGYLNVYLKKNGVLGRPIWRQNGNKGNRWMQGKVNIRTNSNLRNALVNTNIPQTV